MHLVPIKRARTFKLLQPLLNRGPQRLSQLGLLYCSYERAPPRARLCPH